MYVFFLYIFKMYILLLVCISSPQFNNKVLNANIKDSGFMFKYKCLQIYNVLNNKDTANITLKMNVLY